MAPSGSAGTRRERLIKRAERDTGAAENRSSSGREGCGVREDGRRGGGGEADGDGGEQKEKKKKRKKGRERKHAGSYH